MTGDIQKAKAFFDQGLRFKACAERCMGDINDDGSIQIIGGKYFCLSTPTMVNSAFACEMLFKAILICHGIDYTNLLKGNERHNLYSLFNLLPKEEYKEFLRTGEQEDFEQKLKQHSMDFYEWRYYMENPGDYRMAPMFTHVLMDNLSTLAEAIILDN